MKKINKVVNVVFSESLIKGEQVKEYKYNTDKTLHLGDGLVVEEYGKYTLVIVVGHDREFDLEEFKDETGYETLKTSNAVVKEKDMTFKNSRKLKKNLEKYLMVKANQELEKRVKYIQRKEELREFALVDEKAAEYFEAIYKEKVKA